MNPLVGVTINSDVRLRNEPACLTLVSELTTSDGETLLPKDREWFTNRMTSSLIERLPSNMRDAVAFSGVSVVSWSAWYDEAMLNSISISTGLEWRIETRWFNLVVDAVDTPEYARAAEENVRLMISGWIAESDVLEHVESVTAELTDIETS